MLGKLLSKFRREKIMILGTDLESPAVRKVPQWWFLWWHYYWYQDGYEHYSPVMYDVTEEERERFLNKTTYITEQFKNYHADIKN